MTDRKNFRLYELDTKMLDHLTERLQWNESKLLRFALRCFYFQEQEGEINVQELARKAKEKCEKERLEAKDIM